MAVRVLKTTKATEQTPLPVHLVRRNYKPPINSFWQKTRLHSWLVDGHDDEDAQEWQVHVRYGSIRIHAAGLEAEVKATGSGLTASGRTGIGYIALSGGPVVWVYIVLTRGNTTAAVAISTTEPSVFGGDTVFIPLSSWRYRSGVKRYGLEEYYHLGGDINMDAPTA
jgi:hypothetical protein